MRKTIKIILAALGSLVILAILVSLLFVVCLSSAVSNPSYKESIRTAEKLLGCSLDKKYEFVEYKARYNHPDRPLHFVVKIPDEQFQKVVEYCETEARQHDKDLTTDDGKSITTVSPITFTRIDRKRGEQEEGFMKTRFVESCNMLVFKQKVFVNIDKRQIEYDHSRY